MSIILFLLTGLLAGWIASSLMKGEGLGLLGNLVVGVIGAFIGGFIFDVAGVVVHGFWPSLGMSVIGAIMFLFILGLFTGNFIGRRPLGRF